MSGSGGNGGAAGDGSMSCTDGAPCTPTNRCHVGIRCGGAACVDTQINLHSGAECGAAQICDQTGQCIAPQCTPYPANLPNCVPEHPCHIGSCFGSPPHCTDLTVPGILPPAADGVACGPGLVNVCLSGECVVNNCTATGQPCSLACANASGKPLPDTTPCESNKLCVAGRCVQQFTVSRPNEIFSYVPGVAFTKPLAIVTDALTSDTSAAVSATIHWPDNTTSPGVVTGGSGTFTVTGSHTFAASGTQEITVSVPGSVQASTLVVDTHSTTFASPNSPTAITVGPDNNLWVAKIAGVTRVTTAGVQTTFPAPTGNAITSGPDGNLWLAAANEVVRVTPAGAVTEFPLPTSNVTARGIAPGPDGNLWFTESATSGLAGGFQKIGRIAPAGVITEFGIPTADSYPLGIAAGPDGALWFVEQSASKIGRITIAGVVTEFATPTANSGPGQIALGPDGNLWFSEAFSQANRVARITVLGAITEFALSFNSLPDGITAGPDGRLWFAEHTQIGAVTTAGVVSEYRLWSPDSAPRGIAAGPDGNLWLTEPSANRVVRYIP